MVRRSRLCALCALAPLVLGAVPPEPAQPPSPDPKPAPTAATTPAPAPAASPAPANTADDEDQLAAAGLVANRLGERLLAAMQTANPGKTVMISPTGINVALFMLAQGASSATVAAFEKALGQGEAGFSLAGATAAQAKLQESLRSQSVTIAQANGAFAGKDGNFAAPFVASIGTSFGARAETVDFKTDAATKHINAFVAEATRNAIPSLLDPLPPETRFVLVNALYFKGDWATPFSVAATKPMPFKVAAGAPQDRPTMNADARLRYLETDAFQAVALPYTDPRYELVVMLQKDAAKPVAAGWIAALESSKFSPRQGKLALPKMTLTFDADVLKPLRANGFEAALGPAAKFAKMMPGPVAVSQVVHATRFVVDEQGTEAAAATAITGTRSAGAPGTPFVMVVDRPYYLVLRERVSGAALFAGFVADPGEK